jgi:exosortase
MVANGVNTENDNRAATKSLAKQLKVLAIGIVCIVLYGGVIRGLAIDWWTLPSQSQGLLIPPLALFIAWERRALLFSREAKPDGRGLFLLAMACAMFLLGRLSAEYFLARFSLVILVIGMVWTFWGLSRLRVLALPCLLLATMVPPPAVIYNAAAAPLQLLASSIATTVAQSVGVTVYRDGNVIHLANISLGVEEACSGLHSLSALFVGGILLAFLNCDRLWARAVVILSSIPISIAMNVFRVSGTAIMADFKQELALGFYHSFSGWFIFLLGFGLLYLTAQLIHRIADKA